MLESNHHSRLKVLKLYGMAEAWRALHAESSRQALSPEGMLLRLLDAEQADRQARSLAYQLKAARFPMHRDPASAVSAPSTSPGRIFSLRPP